MNLSGVGKALIFVGAFLVLIGLVFMVKDNIAWVGRLPADIYIKRDNLAFYFPLTTCIIISIVVTLLFALFRK